MEIMKIFSDMEGDERLYSVLLSEDELVLLESMYSDGDGLRTGDKVGIWTAKHLQGKKDREAMIEAYDGPNGKGHKLGKRYAKYAGIGASLVTVPAGMVVGHGMAGKKGAALGAAAGAAYAGAAAGGSYLGARAGVALNRKLRKHSRDLDDRSQRVADRNKVADGKMTKEEYAKKHNKK